MFKKEANFSILFRHWLRANPQVNASYEIKDTRGKNYFPFGSLEPAQIAYALAIESSKGTFIRVLGGSGEPDYIYLRSAPAYIVIRYPDFFSIIKIKNFLKEKEKSRRQSLSIERAREISSITVDL